MDFKNKRAEEMGKESQNTNEKNYEDYVWKDLCGDPIKLKKALSAGAKQISQTP